MPTGILLLDKPQGLTSNGALQRVRKAYRRAQRRARRYARSHGHGHAAVVPGRGHQGHRRDRIGRQVLRVHRAARAAHRYRRCRRAGGRAERRCPRWTRARVEAALGRVSRRPAAGAPHVFGAEARWPAALRAGAPGHRSRTRGARPSKSAVSSCWACVPRRSNWSANAPRAPTSACWARTSPAGLGTLGHLTRLRRDLGRAVSRHAHVHPGGRAGGAPKTPAESAGAGRGPSGTAAGLAVDGAGDGACGTARRSASPRNQPPRRASRAALRP